MANDVPDSGETRLPRSRGQRAVRLLASVLLAISAGLVALGSTIWAGRLQGLDFVRYWSWCLLGTVLAGGVALWDLVLVRRAFQRRHRELFRQQFLSQEFAAKLGRKPGPDADNE